jgi:hypothetical protein
VDWFLAVKNAPMYRGLIFRHIAISGGTARGYISGIAGAKGRESLGTPGKYFWDGAIAAL